MTQALISDTLEGVVSSAPQLPNSQLRTPAQMEMLSGDTNLAQFNLQMRNKAGIKLVEAIISADIERTIDGASTLTVVVNDTPDRAIQLSGRLGRKVDVNVDGLWWTLVSVKKSEQQLTLVFEEREVNLLRYYDSFMYQDRKDGNRAHFVLRMIKEVTEQQLRWIIPELDDDQPISDVLNPGDVILSNDGVPLGQNLDQVQQDYTRAQGIHLGTKLKVQGADATAEQINNANIILAVGQKMGANDKVLLSSIMTAIDESGLVNNPGGLDDSAGLFQQRPSQGWGSYAEVTDPPTAAASYFKAAISVDKSLPDQDIWMLCQGVQHSGTPDGSNYARYLGEATAFINAYGSQVPASAKDALKNAKADAKTTQEVLTSTDSNSVADQNQYYIRGSAQTKGDHIVLTKKNSWDTIVDLAREVNWRAFVISGVIYYISEQRLFKSKPFMLIDEDTDGIDWINYDYDEGKRQATVTVECYLSRWSAPPGSVIAIQNMGIIDGRWLVTTVARSLYESKGTITLTKPKPKLPEPVTLSQLPQLPSGSAFPDNADGSGSGGASGGTGPSTGNDSQTPAYDKYPLAAKGIVIGKPGGGTHDWYQDPNNWESDNAVDISIPYGTTVFAIEAGTIGSQIGPIESNDPRMAGLRLHLMTVTGDEFYYAHLSQLAVKAGDIVTKGQILGLSGAANGANHLHLGERNMYQAEMHSNLESHWYDFLL